MDIETEQKLLLSIRSRVDARLREIEAFRAGRSPVAELTSALERMYATEPPARQSLRRWVLAELAVDGPLRVSELTRRRAVLDEGVDAAALRSRLSTTVSRLAKEGSVKRVDGGRFPRYVVDQDAQRRETE